MRRALSVLAVLLAGLGPAGAQETAPGQELRRLENQLKAGEAEKRRLAAEADALAQREKALRRRLVSAARVVQDRELQVITLEAKLADLVRLEADKRKQLDANRNQFASVLVALQRMAVLPPEAVLAYASRPEDMVRGAILLRGVVPEIEERAAGMKRDLDALSGAREKIAAQRLTLANASKDLAAQRREIQALIRETRKLREERLVESREAAERVQRLASRAKDLRGLMRSLAKEAKREAARARVRDEAERKARIARLKRQTPISKRKGKLPYPVVGKVVGRYGGVLSGGVARRGIDIRTRAGAQVIAPHGGKVVYADKFRGYGNLLILDHGNGFHSLLAGMRDIQTAPGARIESGEPVGFMAPEGAQTLYLEFRRKGEAINPLPWLTASR